MTIATFIAIAIGVTATMAAVDFAHAQYAMYMAEHRRTARFDLPWWQRLRPSVSPNLWRAARWSVVQWGCAGFAFAVSVKVSLWFLPFEGAGLLVGTLLGGAMRPRESAV